MRFPTRYGDTQLPSCPFCGRNALSKNAQGVPVCSTHRSENLPDTNCACGSRLVMLQGKWGPYYLCHSCGPQGMKKVMAIMDMQKIGAGKPANMGGGVPSEKKAGNTAVAVEKKESSGKREIAITTNDVEWF